MRLSIVSDPVKRPDIIYPHRAVDVIHGRVEDLVSKKAEGKKKF
ncbi:MAG: cyanobactin biosynthesis system PatB/AcyB/McaB family protein [Iphinoe sp. HA4291-MV1]|nr:cyanobactin biosynthesis system PatB/AcyB/McaB family protein [Iphinoe sp. HA4291-MV1]